MVKSVVVAAVTILKAFCSLMKKIVLEGQDFVQILLSKEIQ